MQTSSDTAQLETARHAARRASWCGQLQLGTLQLPVKAYTTTPSSSDSRLHYIHAGCGRQVEQPKLCPEHGKLPADQIAKAYACAPDRHVVLTQRELAALKPADDKTIELTALVASSRIEPIMLSGRSFYFSSDCRATDGLLAAFHQTLTRRGSWALGRMVLSSRRQLVAVMASEHLLILLVLRNPSELRASCVASDFGRSSGKSEVDLIQQHMARLSDRIDWAEWCDDYDAKLIDLIQGKLLKQARQKKRRSRKRTRAA